MEAVVEYNYVAQEPDELTLRKGDVITEIKVMLGGWWEGTLRDKRGMFPDNFVKILKPPPGSTATSTGSSSEMISSGRSEDVPLRNKSTARKWCKVLFSYEPCNPDELTLVPGDSIEFLGEVEEGWWRGRLKGLTGVFPSNFVAQPTTEEPEKQKEREYCRVLYPYKPANGDELALAKGEIITIISKDAPDEGWWKGELHGQIGLFPDNFVEIIDIKSEQPEQEQKRHDSTSKSTGKYSHQGEKCEKAHSRRNLDVLNFHSDQATSTETTKKSMSTTPSSSASSTSPCIATGSGEKKSIGTHSIISSLKRLVGDVGSNNGNGNTNAALGEELDGVERGEGAPLSHLTASRAKAPRRRPPSSQRLRRHAGATLPTSVSTPSEDNLTNGSADSTAQLRDEKGESLAATARRKAPWAQELKLNHLERRKIASIDRVDKSEMKKERSFTRLSSTSAAENVIKTEPEPEEVKQKEKERVPELEVLSYDDPASDSTSNRPVYIPYSLYIQLVERVAALEERQAKWEQTVERLTEQLTPLLRSSSLGNKD